MGLKIVDLLKWKTSVILLDGKGMPILNDNKPVEVHLKVIGDDDLDKAHRAARLASASLRKTLQDTESDVYKDRVAPIMDADRESCIDLIMQYRTANLGSEARVNTPREELPTIEEFAIEPDAPSLEELENLDAALVKQDEDYEKAVEEYISTRTDIIRAELEALSLEELRTIAMDNIAGIMALAEFFTELTAQKLYYGTFVDKEYKTRAFDSVDEFIATDSVIKEQLIEAYTSIEYDGNQIKK